MSEAEYISFSVLRVPERDVLGVTSPLRAMPFQAHNALGEVREVQDYNEVRQLGGDVATRLINTFGSAKS